MPRASVLLTAERNAALQALLIKLAKNSSFREQLLAFGQQERLGKCTAPYQLEYLLQRLQLPAVAGAVVGPAQFVAGSRPCEMGLSWLNVAFLLLRGLQQTRALLLTADRAAIQSVNHRIADIQRLLTHVDASQLRALQCSADVCAAAAMPPSSVHDASTLELGARLHDHSLLDRAARLVQDLFKLQVRGQQTLLVTSPRHWSSS